MTGVVEAVHRAPGHGLGKDAAARIELLEGLGVEGDAHLGRTVQHRSRARRHPGAPNLRQVHLLAAETLDELRAWGFAVAPGALGENVTTRGVDLLGLPAGTRLRLGAAAVVEVTGLRNPCRQLDGLAPGLMAALLRRRPDGSLERRAGVMGVVAVAGAVAPGDPVVVARPAGPPRPLRPV